MRTAALILCLLLAQAAQAGDLTLDFKHDEPGTLYATIFRAGDGFGDPDKAVHKIKQDTAQQGSQMVIRNLPAGRYAVKAFLDLNGNGTLDKNLVGMPKEPYGFSNDARAPFGPPSIEAASFEQKTGNQKLTIQLD